MHTLTSFLTIGVLGPVFGLAAMVVGVIVVIGLYAPVREACEFLLGWRHVTCPQTRTAVDVRVRRAPQGSARRLVVESCSRFGGAQPSCHQDCLSPITAG